MESFIRESVLRSGSGLAGPGLTALNGAREFYDPETASSSGVFHVPSQPLSISVHGIHTHSVHDVQYSLFTSTDGHYACLWLKMSELQHLCAPKRIRHQVSHVIPLLVSSTSPLFQSTTARSTTWTARRSRRRH